MHAGFGIIDKVGFVFVNFQASALHVGYFVAHENCFLEVVGYEQRGDGIFCRKALEKLLHPLSCAGVETAEGFVQEQQCRIGNDGSAEGNALPLTTGQLVGHLVFLALELETLDHGCDFRLYLLIGKFLYAQAESNVLKDVEMRKKQVFLIEVYHISLAGCYVVDVFAGKTYRTANRPTPGRR